MANPTPVSQSADGAIKIEDFWAFPSAHTYIYLPLRDSWPAESVNSILAPVIDYDAAGNPLKRNGKIVRIKPTLWLEQNRRVEQMTWTPGHPEIIADKQVVLGGWKERPGCRCLNLYMPPSLVLGDATQAQRWLDHVYKVYDDQDAAHIIRWLAQRVQRPGEKINHALVLGGRQGVGKDSLLAPIRHAVGPWNYHAISPPHLLGPHNSYVKSMILLVSEAHDLGEGERINRFAFYDHTKIYAATPPDVLLCSDKYIRAHYVFNVCGLVLTTNHKTDGLYLPADDRRHYVAWSPRSIGDFSPKYWNELWNWYEAENGYGHVGAYLQQVDLSNFDPKAPPKQTSAFWDIVGAGQAPEDAEIADVLDELERPGIVSLVDLLAAPSGAALDWLLDRKRQRALPYRLERAGYVSCRDPDSDQGLWRINGRRLRLYVKTSLPPNEWLAAARDCVLRRQKPAGKS
jgi:hypothetical protein